MPMTRSEAAASASQHAARKRRRERENRLIAELRERGRLVDMRVMPHEDAISVAAAVDALRDLDPSHEEMRSMLGYLAGYDQRGLYAAVRMTLHTREYLAKTAASRAAAHAARIAGDPESREHHNCHYGASGEPATVRIERHLIEGPRPAPGTWCQCDWLGEGTPLHAMSGLCQDARPDARRACGVETPNGRCDLVSTHPVGPMFPGFNGHLADTSGAGRG